MYRRVLILSLVVVIGFSARADEPKSLPGTKLLTTDDDLAMKMVAGIDAYLMRELDASEEKRPKIWKGDKSSAAAYEKSIQPHRDRLKQILGVVDERVKFDDLEYVSGPNTPSLVAETDDYKVHAVRWPVFPGVYGEGLLLEPKGKVLVQVVAIPDADMTPEMTVGLTPGLPKEWQFARRLAEFGCRVLVPTLIDRKDDYSGNPKLGKMTNQPHREFIYRMAYEMGRHIIGYEIQKVLAAVDWMTRDKDHAPVAVVGANEGCLIAQYSAGIDTRIRRMLSLGRDHMNKSLWKAPIYRNVWGIFPEFDDTNYSNFVALLAPRTRFGVQAFPLVTVDGPPTARPGRSGAAPGFLPFSGRSERPSEAVPLNGGNTEYPETNDEMGSVIRILIGYVVEGKRPAVKPDGPEPKDLRKNFDPAARQKRQFEQLVDFTQKLMRDAEAKRAETFWAKLDTSSPEKYAKSTEPLRKQFYEEIIGRLPDPTSPSDPHSRLAYDTPKWKGYEVTLDLYPDVFAYGILLLPKDLKPGEKRPVVVCQHGLEGRPQDVVNPKEKTKYYNSFGAQLADRGFIVFAPQNPYIGQDKFRVLQRKANPLGLSLFSFIVRQHERILEWLAGQPFVDPERMAFYGLSYGGKTAMRVPAILPRYCLSICSGDFNEWTWKNVSVDYRGSYMFTNEYEMPEFNMGNTVVYAEMAALIAPRPFMVERGHNDGVGIDEWVAYEYAKVRRHYAKLKIPERTEIEFFDGGHEIHGQGTFAFLHKHLKWPEPK